MLWKVCSAFKAIPCIAFIIGIQWQNCLQQLILTCRKLNKPKKRVGVVKNNHLTIMIINII